MPHAVDTIILPTWLIPVEPPGRVLTNYGVAIDGAHIVAVLPREQIDADYTSDNRITLDGHALFPGLVNAHTHAAMTLLRGFADDLPLDEWLNRHIWPAEKEWVNETFVQVGGDLAIAEMLRGGVTCFNDMYFHPDVMAKRAEHAGMRACVGMIVIDFPSGWAADADEYFVKGIEVHDAYADSDLITTAFAPHAPYSVANPQLERVRIMAEELDCQIHMHIHETAHEIEQSRAQFNMRPLERLDQLGLLSQRLCGVHLTQLLPGEIQTLAARGVHAVHCPQSNLKFANGFCPLQKLIDAGVNVGIGTDGAASNNDLDMLDEARTAALLAKGVAENPTALGAHAALHAATLGGARALGLGDVTGSIVAGKYADLAAMDLSACATTPVFHPAAQIIYSGAREQVKHVWVAGKQLLRDAELVFLDEEKILSDARAMGERISANQ